MSTRMCLLIRCETVDMGTGADAFVHLSAGAGAYTYDSVRWTDAILDPNLLRIEYNAFPVANGLGGRSLPAVGALTLLNDRRAQDLLVRRAWDGRPITVWRGPVGAAFADFTPLLVATTDQPTFDADTGKILVPIRDASVLFNRPALTEKFAGSGGLEGTAAMAGTNKPRLIGYAHQFEPVLVDPARKIYMIAAGGFGSQSFAPKERGKLFGVDAVSDVYAWSNSPVPGRVGVSYADGVMALGAQPQGVITCDAGLGTFDRHATAVIYLLQQLLNFDFLPPLDLAGLTALSAALPARMGMYLRDGDRTVASVLDEIATSAGAWWGLTPTGTFTMRQWAWGTPVATLKEGRDFRGGIKAEVAELPVSKFYFRFGHRLRPLTLTDLGNVEINGSGEANELARAEVQNEWLVRQHLTDDTSKRRLARELTIDSLYADLNVTPVIAAMQQQGKLLAADRWRLSLEVRGRAGAFLTADTIALDTPRFGFGGSQWLVSGWGAQFQPDPEDDRTTLRLWGPRGPGGIRE